MTVPPTAVRACVFDAYGTLFDTASAVEACRPALGEKTGALARLWRDKQLQYTWLRTVQGRHADFGQVTGDALDFALQALDLGEGLWDRLMSLYLALDPYPEARGCLEALKARGLVVAILSNGSPAMLEPLVRNAGMDGLFDKVLSVERVGVYKPDARVYQLAVDVLGFAAREIAFVSANGWDAYGASAFGLRTAWCNRAGSPPERLPGGPEWEIRNLSELPKLLLD